MVKVGDRVRFLNSVGGGIVKKINKDIALVEEEDGFETPVLLRECVVIEAGKKYSDPVPEKRTDSPQISRNIIQEEEEEAAEKAAKGTLTSRIIKKIKGNKSKKK